jgi:hypothetical protein
MKTINGYPVKKQISLPSGGTVFLVDTLGLPNTVPKEEVVRNVYCYDTDKQLRWTNAEPDTIYERSPFTNVYLDGCELKGCTWDGVEFIIDLTTGDVHPQQLLK